MSRVRTQLCHAHNAAIVRARAGKGFTLIETLVAIGAVALVAVGLAAIFDSVGKTVTGGRRASRLTSFASIIEGQFRKDFDAMIRDKGVLVIRQNIVDTAGGQRRADEITFFAHGDFKSVRPPVHPNRVPASDTALIYYGHGAVQSPDYSAGLANTFLYPGPGPYRAGGGQNYLPLPDDLGAGENAKVSHWTLLRYATLLVKPQKDVNANTNFQGRTEDSALVEDQLGLNTTTRVRLYDRPTQFGLQPASPSIFRNVARAMNGVPDFAPSTNLIRERANEGVPMRSSGIVDIAVGDLDEVRSFIETGLAIPGAAAQPVGASPWFSNIVVREGVRFRTEMGLVLRPFGTFGLATIPAPGGYPPSPDVNSPAFDAIDGMHAWMADLFPAQSDKNGMYQAIAGAAGGLLPEEPARMRYEPTSPGLLDVIDPQGDAAAYANDPAMMASLYGDQIAVSASNFLPRCTEFIVEWSFGDSYPRDESTLGIRAGDLIWHGPDRDSSSSNPNWRRRLASPYPFYYPGQTAAVDALWHRTAYPLRGNTNQQRYYEVSPRLIYGYDVQNSVLGAADGASLTSYFGYVDPTFDFAWPQRAQAGRSRVWALDANGIPVQVTPTGSEVRDADGDGNNANDPTDSATTTLPWAWPKLIRITLKLADPRQSEVEETFQYVFGVPE